MHRYHTIQVSSMIKRYRHVPKTHICRCASRKNSVGRCSSTEPGRPYMYSPVHTPRYRKCTLYTGTVLCIHQVQKMSLYYALYTVQSCIYAQVQKMNTEHQSCAYSKVQKISIYYTVYIVQL